MTPPLNPINGKIRYNIAMREPARYPVDDVVIPPPPQAPSAPSSVSLLTLVLPPAIMIAGTIISTLLMGNKSLLVVLPMVLMGLGYPAANLITNKAAKKKYQQAMEARQANYIRQLREVRSRIEGLMEQQRAALEELYPSAEKTIAIGQAAGKNNRLWRRRTEDPDFLHIRLGSGDRELSFKIVPPTMMNQGDPLAELPYELIERYEKIENVPFVLELKRLGSLTLFSASMRSQLRLTRRLLLDTIIHHSPEDVNVFILADRLNASEQWEWLKWVPHTHALESGYEGRNLLFTTDKINNFLDVLKKLHIERLEKIRSYNSSDAFVPSPAIMVVLDDNGTVRQHEDIRQMAENGYRTGIYLIFMGEDGVPSTCRAKVELDSAEKIHYLESIQAMGTGNQQIAVSELLRGDEVMHLARTLAGLDVVGGKNNYVLPSMVKVIDILPGDPFSIDEITARWQKPAIDAEQVLFPVGQYVDRTGLATYSIDFRPEGIGGKGAYHAMMIGTTGSGKSIFMQSMVLAAAHRYSPRQLNFMFMDFKAGAAELKKISDLPHSVGMVTDLSPQLADRALQALENELARRKVLFDNAGKITDIWDFNRRFPDQGIPHLLVVIDEFAEGINILPNLVERLKELGRQGRAFGIYFFLANQEVNPAVDQLKANVGWYVLLKVNRQEEMNLIGKNLPVPPGRGRGYVKVKSDITTVQSAYAGLPANQDQSSDNELDEYVISTFGPDGERKELYRFDPRSLAAGATVVQSELDLLLAVIKDATHSLSIPPARPIYLEPLQSCILLREVVNQIHCYRTFEGSEWKPNQGERNVIPIGYLDIPQRCQQMPFSMNFNDEGGHLWIIGTPSSGKESVLLSIAFMLAFTHTPAEVNLFGLDFGNGQLANLEAFPHTGAIIRPHEAERIERLFRFLQQELQQRTVTDWRREGSAEIYLFVNNVADFRQQYPEAGEELGRFIRSGGSAGIHIIITSNRGSELPRSLSGIIPCRLALQMADKQEYLDVVNTVVPLLTQRTEGRGYLVANGLVAECQIALPDPSLLRTFHDSLRESSTEIDHTLKRKEEFLANLPQTLQQAAASMRNAWAGIVPPAIEAMTDVLTLPQFAAACKKARVSCDHSWEIPFGLDYETLKPTLVNMWGESPFWTILGPRQSGKSTVLLNIMYQIKHALSDKGPMDVFRLRRGCLTSLNDTPNIHFVNQTDEMVEILKRFPEKVAAEPERFHSLIMDDLGLAFSTNNTALMSALNHFNESMTFSHHQNYLVVVADLYSNLKSPQTFSSSFMKTLQQSQTGIFLSMDDNDMQWFNSRIPMNYKKTVKWLPGRGFLVYKGKTEYMQTPLLTADDLLPGDDHQAGGAAWEK